MTVRELLTTISTILKTHEVVTLTSSSTKLIIDIEHNCHHVVGKYSKSDINEYSCTYTILKPFEHIIYKDYQNKQHSILDDFEVYRWKLDRKDNSYEWYLDIETKQN